MASPLRLDAPEAVSSFLEAMKKKFPSSVTNEADSQEKKSGLDPESKEFSPQVPSSEQKAQPVIVENGVNPFPQISTDQKLHGLDLVQDDNGVVTEVPSPNATLAKAISITSTPQVDKSPLTGRPITSTQHRLLMGKVPGVEKLTEKNLSELRQQTQGYMEAVVAKFKESHMSATSPAQPFVPANSSLDIKEEADSQSSDSIPFPVMDETPIKPEIHTSEDDIHKSGPKEDEWEDEPTAVAPSNIPSQLARDHNEQENNAPSPFPTLDESHIEKSPRGSSMSTYGSAVRTIPPNKTVVVQEPTKPRAVDSDSEETMKEQENSGVMVEEKPKTDTTAFKHVHSPTIVVTASTETDESGTGDEEEDDRKDAIRFSSWGTPLTRNKLKSRRRTIILSGLPSTANYTLVQSRIHGGAVEYMRLAPSDPKKATTSAFVTFISADSCDRYYDMYPNGFELRYGGKRWPIFVSQRDQVDVVSGMLRGYLDCGATRVVRVTNADDDWGLVALNKFAEGKNRARQVEAIQDTFSNGTRNISFRFGNIAHAVQFKGVVIRSDDWEGCHADFAEDPCAKATDFHDD